MQPHWSRRLFGNIQKWAYGANIEERLRELEKTQWLSRDELRETQWRKLTKLLQHAYINVPYYKRIWSAEGIHPSDIRSWDDFEKLPLLDKPLIQQHYDELLAEGREKVSLYYGGTSGSTGTPMRFVRTQDSKARFWSAQYRGYGWFGISLGDKQGRLYGMPFDQVNSFKERAKDWIMNRRRISVFDMTDERMRAFAQKLTRFQPVYLNGYPSAVSQFAEFMCQKKQHARFPWIPLKGVVTTSEVLTPTYQELIEKAFECPVINEYGAAEIGLVAISCPKGGFHTVPENIYLETISVIDVSLGQDVGTTPVETVVTDLHNYAMPFIRYKGGDLINSPPDQTRICECGRTSWLIDTITGRKNSLVITPEGKILPGMIFDYLAKWSLQRGSGIRQFVAEQVALDKIVFYIVKSESYSDTTLNFLTENTHKHLGPSVMIDVKFVDSVPLTTTGKLTNFSSTLNVNEALAQIKGSIIQAAI